ncbi:MAG TPA: hypothetical protein VFU49_16620, partial [Ktedonobacteraceae bacterium]|nr:hypothetical protein [Ktedonobacteraceae bacterium]
MIVPCDGEPRRPLAHLPSGRAGIPLRHLLFSLVLCVSLGLNVLSGWPLAVAQAHAATLAAPPPPSMTLAKALAQPLNDGKYHGPFQYPTTVPPVPGVDHATKASAPLPSAEPAKMQPVSLLADTAFLSANSLSAHGRVGSGIAVSPLHMQGSDGRLCHETLFLSSYFAIA